ncbi:MAG: transcriptional repressor [Synergistaceae bacterium]|nr:transcriptional repressor [Synergistaceae bacterium]
MQVEKILSSAGLRMTRQRKVVLELLLENGSPLSHSEISSMLDEPLDKVTLYRTLQTLRSAAIVHQVQGLDGVWRFCAHDPDTKGCPGDHPHFLCLYCGKMFCLTDQHLPRIEVPEGMKVEGKQLVVYGCCPECAPKKKDGEEQQ